MPPFIDNHELARALEDGRWQPHFTLTTNAQGFEASFQGSDGAVVKAQSTSQAQALSDLRVQLFDLALTGNVVP